MDFDKTHVMRLLDYVFRGYKYHYQLNNLLCLGGVYVTICRIQEFHFDPL
jgi:hypothetical protein